MPRKHKHIGGIIGADPLVDGAVDANWDDVVLLLDGTSTTDKSTAGNNFTNDGADLNQAPSPDHPYAVEPGSFGVTGPNDTGAGTRKHLYSASGAFNTLDTGAFTIEMWVKADDLTGPRGIFCIGPFSGTANVVFRTDDTTLEGTVDGTNNLVAHQTSLSTNTWYHIALVWDGSETRVYLDGIKSTASNTSSPAWNNGLTARIGRHYDNYDGFYWDGQITDVRITEGVARYTADFDRPTASFPTTTTAPSSVRTGGVSTVGSLGSDGASTTRPTRRWGGITGRSLVDTNALPTTGVLTLAEHYQTKL